MIKRKIGDVFQDVNGDVLEVFEEEFAGSCRGCTYNERDISCYEDNMKEQVQGCGTQQIIFKDYKQPLQTMESILQERYQGMFWELLQEVESKTNPYCEPRNKQLVENAYQLLNDMEITKAQPRWTKDD